MFQIEVLFKDGTFNSFDSVTSIEIAMGPSHRKLFDDEIRNLEFGSSKDIYIFNGESHLIAANTLKYLRVKG